MCMSICSLCMRACMYVGLYMYISIMYVCNLCMYVYMYVRMYVCFMMRRMCFDDILNIGITSIFAFTNLCSTADDIRTVHSIVLYCIVSIHLYSASCSAHQSEALPVRETQREESSLYIIAPDVGEKW